MHIIMKTLICLKNNIYSNQVIASTPGGLICVCKHTKDQALEGMHTYMPVRGLV